MVVRDAKLRKTCYHYVNGTAYKKDNCPRCLGKGYYYDIKIDEQGLVEEITGADKLRQELEKIVLVSHNPFHPEYGSKLAKRISTPITPTLIRTILEKDIIHAIKTLYRYQQEELAKGKRFPDDELIVEIGKVEVIGYEATKGEITFVTGDVRSVEFRVSVVTRSGQKTILPGRVVL